MRRVIAPIAACVVMCASAGNVIAQRDAQAILAAARQALTGQAAHPAISSFTASGHWQGTRTSAAFDIACQLPDRFVRTETTALPDAYGGRVSMTTRTGFAGQWILSTLIREGGSIDRSRDLSKTPRNEEEAREYTNLLGIKGNAARLLLGMFADSFAGYPLTFQYVGRGESSGTEQDIIQVAGEGGFAGQFLVDATTHLPSAVTYSAPRPLPSPRVTLSVSDGVVTRTDEPPSTPSGPPAPPVNYAVLFADYRPVDTIKLPFRVTLTADGKTVQEMTFDRYVLNPTIKSTEFEPMQTKIK